MSKLLAEPLGIAQSSGVVFAVPAQLSGLGSFARPGRLGRRVQALPHPEVKSNLRIPLCRARNLGTRACGSYLLRIRGTSSSLETLSCCAESELALRMLSLPGDTGLRAETWRHVLGTVSLGLLFRDILHLSSEASWISNPTRFYRQIQERMTDSLYL